MTNEQVDRAVQHLCEQLHVAIRLSNVIPAVGQPRAAVVLFAW